MGIHAIAWDVGGDLERTEDMQPRMTLAKRIGLPVFELEKIIFGNDDKYRVQLGEIDMADHQRNVAKKLDLPESTIENVFSEFFAGDVLDRELVKQILNLKQNYCSAIISNYAKVLRNKITDIWKIDDAFHYLICSAEVGLMKPNLEIYQLALEKIGFAPHETIFIDDFVENIEGAENIGMQGILFKNREQALADLGKLLETSKI